MTLCVEWIEKNRIKETPSEDDSGLIIQAGAGYNFTPNLAAEVAYTYVNAFDGFNGVNAQLKYNF